MENYSDFRRTNYPGLLMYFVAHYLEVEQNKLLRPYGVTHSQTQLLAYLYAHQDQDIFQKDLERIFNLKGSTVTRLLQLLKDKGLASPSRKRRPGCMRFSPAHWIPSSRSWRISFRKMSWRS